MALGLKEIQQAKKAPLTESQLSEMREVYSERQIDYIAGILGRDDVIPIKETRGMGVGDYLAVAIMEDIRNRKPETAGRLSRLVVKNMVHYAHEQINWLEYEGKMCELNEKRKIDMKDREEYQHVLHVFNDEHHNNKRFNLFYRIRNRGMCSYQKEAA